MALSMCASIIFSIAAVYACNLDSLCFNRKLSSLAAFVPLGLPIKTLLSLNGDRLVPRLQTRPFLQRLCRQIRSLNQEDEVASKETASLAANQEHTLDYPAPTLNNDCKQSLLSMQTAVF